MKHLFSSSSRSTKLLSGSRFFMHLGTFSRSGMWLLLFGLMVHTLSLQAQAPAKEWDKSYQVNYLKKIVPTPDGGYLLIGGLNDYTVVKIDSLGEKQWVKILETDRGANVVTAIRTSDGGFLLGGYSASDIGEYKS